MTRWPILGAIVSLISVPASAASSGKPERPVSYLYDVVPTLTRSGCNQGTCHGNRDGRGGLKLSLRGENPEDDWLILTRNGGGRRVDRQDPGRSLLLLKATSNIPHGGGIRFTEDSVEYARLSRWIAEGAKMDPPGTPRIQDLTVVPGESILHDPRRNVKLSVTALFSDGSRRDVTALSYASPGDPRMTVSESGIVAGAPGQDGAVLFKYAGRLANSRVTFLPRASNTPWPGEARPRGWVDQLQFSRLQLLGLTPSSLTTESEFLRRVFLDLLGVLPTADEVRSFSNECDQARRAGAKDTFAIRAAWVDRLLQRPEFADYWSLKWTDLLRLEVRTLDPRGDQIYRDWIRSAIATDMPMDEFARQLLTATGSTYANPPANYYRRTRDPVDLGETTAQVFMGTRMLCAKCHNHPTERWTQDDYYSLAALFSGMTRKLDDWGKRDRFDKHELNGEEEILLGVGAKVIHPRTGLAVSPRIPTQTAALASEAEDPRKSFAAWLTRPGNPYFSRNIVNRVWAALFGKGLVDPVDDLRASNPASNPLLFDRLADEFTNSGFDLKALIRTITRSRTYQLSSEPNKSNANDERFFSRGIALRMPAEVLLDAVSQVTGVPERFQGRPSGTRAVLAPAVKAKHPFLKVFGQPQRESVCDCERSEESTLGQAFALISGRIVESKLALRENRIGELIDSGRSTGDLVQELYLGSLSREPTSSEREAGEKYVQSHPDRRKAFEDLQWALFNTKEFLLRR